MYNPYLPRSWEDGEAPPSPPPARPPAGKKGLGGLLKELLPEELDTGDALLLLILLFLFLGGREDDLDILVTLGLMLIL